MILEAISKRRVEERMIHHLPINHSPIEEIIKDFQRSLVFIRSGVYFGSGVIITSSGCSIFHSLKLFKLLLLIYLIKKKRYNNERAFICNKEECGEAARESG